MMVWVADAEVIESTPGLSRAVRPDAGYDLGERVRFASSTDPRTWERGETRALKTLCSCCSFDAAEVARVVASPLERVDARVTRIRIVQRGAVAGPADVVELEVSAYGETLMLRLTNPRPLGEEGFPAIQ